MREHNALTLLETHALNQEKWTLEDGTTLLKVCCFSYGKAFTYGNMEEGNTDKERREYIREQAIQNWPTLPELPKWCAFRIFVKKKAGKRQFDIENVPKLIVDAFCKKQICNDKRKMKINHPNMWLYDNDTIDEVSIIQVRGRRSKDETEETKVEIFGCYETDR